MCSQNSHRTNETDRCIYIYMCVCVCVYGMCVFSCKQKGVSTGETLGET